MPGYEITEELAGLLVFGIASGVSWALTCLRRATHEISDLQQELQSTRQLLYHTPVPPTSLVIGDGDENIDKPPHGLITSSPNVNLPFSPRSPSNHDVNLSRSNITSPPTTAITRHFSPSVLRTTPQISLETASPHENSAYLSPIASMTDHALPPYAAPDGQEEDETSEYSRCLSFSTPQAGPITPTLTSIPVSLFRHGSNNIFTNDHEDSNHAGALEDVPMEPRSSTPTSMLSGSRGTSVSPSKRRRSETPSAPKHRSGMVFRGHSAMVQSLAILPDETRVVSGSLDRTVKLWQVSTGQSVRTLRGHTGGVYCVAVLPAVLPQCLSVQYSLNQTFRNEHNGNNLHNRGHLSPGGHPLDTLLGSEERVVSGSDDNSIKVWDLASGRCLQTLRGHSDTVACLLVLHDHQADVSDDTVTDSYIFQKYASVCGNRPSWLVSGSWDKTLRVWDLVDQGKCLGVLTGHSRPVQCLAILPRDSTSEEDSDSATWRIVSGSWDRSVRIWDLSSSPTSPTLSYHSVAVLTGHSDYVLCVTVLTVPVSFFACDPQAEARDKQKKVSVLVSGSIDRTIRFWRMDTLPPATVSNSIVVTNVEPTRSSSAHSRSSRTTPNKRQTPTRRHPYATQAQNATPTTNTTSIGNHISIQNGQSTGNSLCFFSYREPHAAVYCLAAFPFHHSRENAYDQNSHLQSVQFVSGSFYRTCSLWTLSALAANAGSVAEESHQPQLSQPQNRVSVPTRWKSPSAAVLHNRASPVKQLRPQLPNTTSNANTSTVAPITTQALMRHNRQHQTTSMLSPSANPQLVSSGPPSVCPGGGIDEISYCLQLTQVMEGHRGTASCVAVFSDGRVISGSRDETLLLWFPLSS
jgi:WD40 repeat protein